MMGTGRIHMYYGDGKGKTTATFTGSQSRRSRTSGALFQFLKDNSSNERKILESVPGSPAFRGVIR